MTTSLVLHLIINDTLMTLWFPITKVMKSTITSLKLFIIKYDFYGVCVSLLLHFRNPLLLSFSIFP